MTGRSELRLSRTAYTGVARDFRHALVTFMAAAGIGVDTSDDIQTAVGEALANAVEHAYFGHEPGAVELHASLSEDRAKLSVDVYDGGTFIEREPVAGRGYGLRIARAIVDSLSIDTRNGTHVHMVFDTAATQAGLQPAS
jgi:anti-sigma regulatory factor (Ser/Thr protein kinase)